MLGKSHVIINETILLPLVMKKSLMPILNINKFSNIIWFSIGIMLGSLLPDIDHQDSILGRFNPISKIMKHRSITHTLWMALLITFLCINFGIHRLHQSLYFGITMGYWLHLIEDSFSVEGITWLYPLTHKHRRRYGYITGGCIEKFFVTLSTFILFTEVLWYFLF